MVENRSETEPTNRDYRAATLHRNGISYSLSRSRQALSYRHKVLALSQRHIVSDGNQRAVSTTIEQLNKTLSPYD